MSRTGTPQSTNSFIFDGSGSFDGAAIDTAMAKFLLFATLLIVGRCGGDVAWRRGSGDHLLTQPVCSPGSLPLFRKGRIELSSRVQVAFIDTHDLSWGGGGPPPLCF